MKIRHGFVSNSSSSSFIIAIKEQVSEPCPHCGRKDKTFLDELKSSSSDNRILSLGKDETLKEISGYWLNDIEKKELVENISSYFNQEYKIACVAISYHDESTREKMNILEKSKKLVILHGDE